MVSRALFFAIAMMGLQSVAVTEEEPLILYGAGSLKAALSDVVAAYQAATGQEVRTAFGPSGLMRQRIENGEPAHVFASANMAHPRRLQADGRSGEVQMFARNRLCAIAQDEIEISESTLLDVIMRPDIRLGTSTPGADPSGDYAWELFANAVLARREVPSLQIVSIPPELAVGADYGLTVLNGAPEAANRLVDFILAPAAQAILEDYGFLSPSPASDRPTATDKLRTQ